MPGCEVFYESPLTEGDLDVLVDPTALYDWTPDGSEFIDGRECLRFVGRPAAPAGKALEVYYIDRATGLHRRAITYNKLGNQSLVVDYRSVALGPPDPSVFELPEGCSVEKL